MKKNELVRFIIDISNKFFSYEIEEFKSISNSVEFWGMSKTYGNMRHYTVFLDEENFGNVDTSFVYSIGDDLNKLTKVLIVNKSNESTNWHIIAENFTDDLIVIEEESKKVLYFSKGSEDLAHELDNIMDYKRRLEVEKRTKKGSLITKILIGLNVLMYAVTVYFSYAISGSLFTSFLNSDFMALMFLGANESSLVTSGEYYRLFTSMFLHGGLLHLALNMYALRALGPAIERNFGKVRYVIIYVVGGLFGSVASYLYSHGASVGASGAIFALSGSILVLAFTMRDKVGKDMLRQIISVIGINLFIGITIPNIDNFAHLGGLFGGGLITLILLKMKGNK